MDKKLKYEKYHNADNIIIVNLYNGYSIVAITGLQQKHNTYNHYLTSLYLKENTVDIWYLMSAHENISFMATKNKLNSAILKEISTIHERNGFQTYIDTLRYELKCFDLGNNILEKEMINKRY